MGDMSEKGQRKVKGRLEELAGNLFEKERFNFMRFFRTKKITHQSVS
jgi:hypothetical protein